MAERPRLETVVSLWRERLPPPGAPARRWGWPDLLDGPSPRDAGPAPAATYVVRHGADDDPDADLRTSYATIVTVERGPPAERVRVDERMAVERRVLAPVLRVERLLVRQVERHGETAMQVVSGGSQRVGRVVGGRPGEAIAAGGGVVAKGARFAGRSARGMLRTLVGAPDWLYANTAVAEAHLKHGRTRRELLKSMLQPTQLSREGKAVALLLSALGVLALVLAATVGVALVAPQWAHGWRAILGFFLYTLTGTVLLPLFPETQAVEVAREVGAAPMVAAGALAMTVGAWITLFVGDEVLSALRRASATRPWLGRGLDRAEGFARRYGFWAAIVLIGIPYFLDTPVFYLLASVGIPMRSYLVGTFAGATIRFGIVALLASGDVGGLP